MAPGPYGRTLNACLYSDTDIDTYILVTDTYILITNTDTYTYIDTDTDTLY